MPTKDTIPFLDKTPLTNEQIINFLERAIDNAMERMDDPLYRDKGLYSAEYIEKLFTKLEEYKAKV